MLIFTLCHYFLFSTNIMWSFINALRSCENVSERFFCRKCDDSRLTGGRIPFFPAVLSWTMCEEQLENKTEEEDDGVSSVHQVQSLVLDVWPSINISLFKMSFIFYWLTPVNLQTKGNPSSHWMSAGLRPLDSFLSVQFVSKNFPQEENSFHTIHLSTSVLVEY